MVKYELLYVETEHPMDKAIKQATLDALAAKDRAGYKQALRFLLAAQQGDIFSVEQQDGKVMVKNKGDIVCTFN